MTDSQPPAGASERFLDAFNAIDQFLRRHWGQRDRWEPFAALLRRAATQSPRIRRFDIDLEQYANLRNAIVHRSRGGEVIAEPHVSTVEAIEGIRDLLLRPPTLAAHFRTTVVTATPDRAVGQVAALMLEGNFSQVPIYSGRNFVALLTAETITRWLAEELSSGLGLLEEAAVVDVIPHAEDPDNYLFLSGGSTAFDALDAFQRFSERGASLDAILLTQSGRPDQRPLGILTVFDMPKLHSLIAPTAA